MTPQMSDTPAPETLRFGYGDTALGTIVVAQRALVQMVHLSRISWHADPGEDRQWAS
jgi:hypothetical protein